MRKITLTIFVWLSVANAHERLFTYSYDTDYLPKNLFEVEQWTTLKTGKENGMYYLWDMRTEFEYAITERTHVALYLNYSSLYNQYYDNGNIIEKSYFKFKGVDLAIVHRFSSPREKIGFGIYLEGKYRMNKQEIEEKLLFSKYFGNFLWTLNVIFEQEFKMSYNSNGNLEMEKEAKFMLPSGIAYKFGNFAIGIEAWLHSEFKDQVLPFTTKAEHYAFFLGPALHYSTSKFWTTLTITPQITNVLDEHEKLEARMIFSILF
jgi:hypothetical protein